MYSRPDASQDAEEGGYLEYDAMFPASVNEIEEGDGDENV